MSSLFQYKGNACEQIRICEYRTEDTCEYPFLQRQRERNMKRYYTCKEQLDKGDCPIITQK